MAGPRPLTVPGFKRNFWLNCGTLLSILGMVPQHYEGFDSFVITDCLGDGSASADRRSAAGRSNRTGRCN